MTSSARPDANPDSIPEAPLLTGAFPGENVSAGVINAMVKGIHTCRTTSGGGFLRLSPPNADTHSTQLAPLLSWEKSLLPRVRPRLVPSREWQNC